MQLKEENNNNATNKCSILVDGESQSLIDDENISKEEVNKSFMCDSKNNHWRNPEEKDQKVQKQLEINAEW